MTRCRSRVCIAAVKDDYPIQQKATTPKTGGQPFRVRQEQCTLRLGQADDLDLELPKNGDPSKSPLLPVGSLVPIGRQDFNLESILVCIAGAVGRPSRESAKRLSPRKDAPCVPRRCSYSAQYPLLRLRVCASPVTHRPLAAHSPSRIGVHIFNPNRPQGPGNAIGSGASAGN